MLKTNSNNITALIKEQANQWYLKIERGLSSAEKSELVAWCNQNEANHKALLNRDGTGWSVIIRDNHPAVLNCLKLPWSSGTVRESFIIRRDSSGRSV